MARRVGNGGKLRSELAEIKARQQFAARQTKRYSKPAPSIGVASTIAIPSDLIAIGMLRKHPEPLTILLEKWESYTTKEATSTTKKETGLRLVETVILSEAENLQKANVANATKAKKLGPTPTLKDIRQGTIASLQAHINKPNHSFRIVVKTNETVPQAFNNRQNYLLAKGRDHWRFLGNTGDDRSTTESLHTPISALPATAPKPESQTWEAMKDEFLKFFPEETRITYPDHDGREVHTPIFGTVDLNFLYSSIKAPSSIGRLLGYVARTDFNANEEIQTRAPIVLKQLLECYINFRINSLFVGTPPVDRHAEKAAARDTLTMIEKLVKDGVNTREAQVHLLKTNPVVLKSFKNDSLFVKRTLILPTTY